MDRSPIRTSSAACCAALAAFSFVRSALHVVFAISGSLVSSSMLLTDSSQSMVGVRVHVRERDEATVMGGIRDGHQSPADMMQSR